MLQRIYDLYDAENDYAVNGPPVTWAEMALADAVTALMVENKQLRNRVLTLETQMARIVERFPSVGEPTS